MYQVNRHWVLSETAKQFVSFHFPVVSPTASVGPGSGSSTENLQSSGFEYSVCFLPPLVLNFELPPDYPSTSPPVFTLSGKWLSQAQVCRRFLTF